jgi:signal transduction histidine kinase
MPGPDGAIQYSEETEVDHSPLDSALFKVVGKIEGKTLTTSIYQNREDKLGDKSWELVDTIKDPKEYVRPCGDASIEIYHYPEDVTFKTRQLDIMGRADVRKFLMGTTMKFDALEGNCGVKIFNDNVRIMPFGERSHPTLYDWANLDRRALQKGGGKISQHRLVGFVRLTRKSNPEIKEVSTREGIKQNAAFTSLVADLVKPTLENLEKYKTSVRKNKIVTIIDNQNTAKKKIDDLEKYLKNIPMDDEDRAVIHDTLSRTAHHISAFAREEAKEKEELVGSLEMLRALSSLGISTLAFAHETQPKLNGIRSGLIGLEGLEGLADKSRERLKIMISTMNEIQSWNDFLDIYASSLSSAKSTTRLAKTEINLREMLTRITDSLDSLAIVKTGAKKTKIQFSTSILGDRANKIHANESAIISVFTNLFLNSIKSLRYVRRIENPSISVDISTEGSYLVIQVHDNGKGIESDNITGQRGTDKITEAFYSSYPKEGPLKGMGLGMTLVREIVEEQYRGELSLKATTYDDDKPGNGSATFEIRIPLKELKGEQVKDVK